MYVRTRDQCCCCCCSLEQNLSSISVFVFIFASLLIRHLFRFCVFAPLNRLALFPRFSFSYNRDFRNAIFWCTCCASSSSADDAGSNRAQQQQQLIVAHTGILAYCIACVCVCVSISLMLRFVEQIEELSRTVSLCLSLSLRCNTPQRWGRARRPGHCRCRFCMRILARRHRRAPAATNEVSSLSWRSARFLPLLFNLPLA